MGTFFTTLGFAVVFITTPRRPRPRRPHPEALFVDSQTGRLLNFYHQTIEFFIFIVEREQEALKDTAVEVNDGFFLVVFLQNSQYEKQLR